MRNKKRKFSILLPPPEWSETSALIGDPLGPEISVPDLYPQVSDLEIQPSTHDGKFPGISRNFRLFFYLPDLDVIIFSLLSKSLMNLAERSQNGFYGPKMKDLIHGSLNNFGGLNTNFTSP